LTLLAAICAMLFSLPAAEGSDGSTLLGHYWLPEKDGQLQVYERNGRFFGRVTAYDVAGQKDENNPDEKLRDRAIVGVDLLSGFRYEADSGRWVDGKIYDAKSGKTYKCRLWFEDGNDGVLWARGFIGFSLLGRTERFERIVDKEN
jgi:uncharacterized protein (DUF2147 family)